MKCCETIWLPLCISAVCLSVYSCEVITISNLDVSVSPIKYRTLLGQDSKLLMQRIFDFEKTLESSDNDDIKKIYKYHVDLASSVKKKFITGVLLISMFYSSAPVSRGYNPILSNK